MASGKSASRSSRSRVNPLIQWVALAVVGLLLVLAAFVLLGESSSGGGHLGRGSGAGVTLLT